MSKRRKNEESKVDIGRKYHVTYYKNSERFCNQSRTNIIIYNDILRDKNKIITYYKNTGLKKLNTFLILISFSHIILCNKLYPINYKYSSIQLTIKGMGTKYIFGSSFSKSDYPSKVIINNAEVTLTEREWNFNREENEVELI